MFVYRALREDRRATDARHLLDLLRDWLRRHEDQGVLLYGDGRLAAARLLLVLRLVPEPV